MTSFRERFKGPWRVEEIPAPGYVIKDAAGNKLAFIYADPDNQQVSSRFTMTMAEAKAFADAICSLGLKL